MGATGLTHPIFESAGAPGRVELDVGVLLAGGLAGPGGLSPGTVARFEDEDPSSPLRVYGVPKRMLVEFRILGAPVSVITSTTLSLIRLLHEAGRPLTSSYDPDSDAPATTRPNARIVLNGRAGTGKSFLLLQLASYAHALRDWIVIYVPRTRALLDGSTPAVYSLQTQTWAQPRAAWNLLSRIGRANVALLARMGTQRECDRDAGHVKIGTPLTELVNLAGQQQTIDHALAPLLLDALLTELSIQTAHPVLLAIDDFQALAMGRSGYRDPQFKGIRPHHLGMGRLLLEFAGGRRAFARGLVIGALSRSDPMFPVPPQLAAALSIPDEFTPSPRSVRERRSAQLASYLEGEGKRRERALRAVRVPDALSVREAAALFEVWLDAGRETGADELFLGKYAESSGNARAFVWGGLLATLQTAK
ncbi:mitochondrial ribosomal death-associated protein 3-domain-containing protein [Mycena metata]|uniref:Small ribosomal subunit protein mS29 n=1 Tax=Mycena metata TaxID=1033252 RepID=A0AAD7MHF9_9AGAR|nr:mitochondrial ribosomal death-associated protein 3-domain-containing protein [Mycena metata]